MSYTYYYDLVANKAPSVGTRTNALIYPGAVCPTACSFGRVHGPSPATGSVTFKGTVMIPIAQPIKIQIGEAVFYGFAVKGTIDNSNVTGNQTTFQLVDMRDRLHDENHGAQYNMIDPNGTWYHLLPQFWDLQIPTYISKLELVEDFTGEQTLPNYNLNLLYQCPPTFSLMSILEFFAMLYNFSFSWAASTSATLFSYRPENLDFNNPTKVIDCIDQMLQRCNLQFTAWGDLHLHITNKGVPDNVFEAQFLSGNIILCNYPYTEASIGAELNTKGRRIAIVGGRNKYEQWFPCYPDWNRNWQWHIVNPFSYSLSALLIKNQLTDINLVEDLPPKFWDCRKHEGRSRMKMSIRDYVKNIPFKVFRADFDMPLCQNLIPAGNDEDGIKLFDEPKTENFSGFFELPNGTITRIPFFYFDSTGFSSTNQQNGLGAGFTDSFYPPSNCLVTDSNRQFMVKASSREEYLKGEKDDKAFFMNGVFTYITDGVNMEVEEYILPPKANPSLKGQFLAARRALLSKSKTKCMPLVATGNDGCVKKYKMTVHFDRFKFLSQGVVQNQAQQNANCEGSSPSDDAIYDRTPDHVYILLSIDREMYTYLFGANKSSPRSREQVISYADLKKSAVCFQEVPMITKNIIENRFLSVVFADEIAKEIAFRKLSHEFITTAGFIKLKTASGYMPSGVVDSVQVDFNAASGLTETINFTNIKNDERVPSFQARVTGRTDIKSSEVMKRDAAIENSKRLLQQINERKQAAAVAGKRHEEGGLLAVAQRFGGEQNAANVRIDVENVLEDIINVGEIMVVHASETE